MEFNNVSKEHLEQFHSASESVDPSSVSPLVVNTIPKSPKSQKSYHGKNVLSKGSPSKGSPTQGSPSKGSPRKHDRHSHSGRDGRPKKGGYGGKGTWGGLLDTEDDIIDPNDPNYDSNEEKQLTITEPVPTKAFEEYKKKVTIIVEEYFATDDVVSTANELEELGMSDYNYYFVKKLLSLAMDRDDKEKEMAAVILSSLYANVLDPSQVHKGFSKLIESADDLIVDIPDTVDVLALFVARAVVDDILPPAFLKKQMASLSKDSKGVEVLVRAEKGYLAAPLHTEIIERKWNGNKNKTVDDVKANIKNLLIEYVLSGDKMEAFRCIHDLKVTFFHHEIVKRALTMAMENRASEHQLLDLLKEASEEGVINSSQMTKGFGRLIDMVDDLSLDILSARELLQSLISQAASEGWLCASSLKSLSLHSKKRLEDKTIRLFKIKVESVIKEYFLSGDILEAISDLESENCNSSAELSAIFVKKLITLAMDRKNREKEMASVLLTSLSFPPDGFVNGFLMLIESADDTALDNPAVVEDIAMFLARAVVDEVLAPQHLEEIGSEFSGKDSIGSKVFQMARSLLQPRLSSERILRCWGGGGSSKPGWEIEDAKDKIGKLLEEYESGGEAQEAFRCIKELGLPFFHHEVVKKALVTAMEKRNVRMWDFLVQSYSIGLITTTQMMKGFGRVADSLDDLALDVPDAGQQFAQYVDQAKNAGWLDSSFSSNRPAHVVENGISS
ncbi:Programmed cell death protein [Thalictrum thalictroides]|uniref:Programmed cell death protein n=1 Tax=Thalictrum thalictroides TaxID=46969 RepID=A0A7J6WBY4_THATH|nr:Programmed cell death protein [Thalictrum thalictroides]